MLFRAGAILSIVCLIQGAFAVLTPDQLVTNINSMTTISQKTDVSLQPLSTTSPENTVKAMGQNLAGNITIIINIIKDDTTAIMDQTQPFGDVDAGLIVNALKEFVTFHQALLFTVIGKHAIFAQFVVTAPIAAALSILEATIDSFAISMINLIQSGNLKASVTADQTALDSSVGKTITIYDEVCVPNPSYPIGLPFCS